jgi:hypothetical protein
LKDLDRLVDPAAGGDPESSLRCTCKNVRQLAEELQQEGHAVSYQTVAELLHSMGYRLQANQKTLEGSQRIRIDSLNISTAKRNRIWKQGEPVISVASGRPSRESNRKVLVPLQRS